MKSDSRTTGVMVGGTAGFMMGGPAGAVVGGVVGGAAMDGITTGVNSAVHNEYRPVGIVRLIRNFEHTNPKDPGQWVDAFVGQARNLHNNLRDPGQWVDVISTVSLYTFTGYSQGQLIKRKCRK